MYMVHETFVDVSVKGGLYFLKVCTKDWELTRNNGSVRLLLWVAIPTFSPLGTFRVSF